MAGHTAAGSEPLRVTLVAACPFPSTRGTAARVLLQATALLDAGVDVRVVAYHLREFEAPAGMAVDRIPSVPGYRRLRAGPTLGKLLVLDPLLLVRALRSARAQRAQLIHGHHVEGALVALAVGRLLGIPALFDAHTSLGAELPSYPIPVPSPLLRAAGSALDGWLVRRCRRVLAVSERLGVELSRCAGPAFDRERVTVSETPLEREERERAEPPRARLRAGGPLRIVYAGGLSRFQRLDLLGAAFERLRRSNPDAELAIVSGDPRTDLEAQWPGAACAPGVEFVCAPDLERTFAELARADVAVSPRTAPGGLPQKILNYMRAGLPVVACAGSADVIHDEQTGLVVPDDDSAAFAGAISRLLESPELRRRLGAAARRAVGERFAPRAAAERIVSLYRDVLAEASGSRA